MKIKKKTIITIVSFTALAALGVTAYFLIKKRGLKMQASTTEDLENNTDELIDETDNLNTEKEIVIDKKVPDEILIEKKHPIDLLPVDNTGIQFIGELKDPILVKKKLQKPILVDHKIIPEYKLPLGKGTLQKDIFQV